MLLTVEDGRVVKVRPDKNAPLNRGRGCVKGMSIIEQMYHPDRIIHPMKRIGDKCSGKWEQITWDEAYDIIVNKISELRDKYGAECIALTTGTGRHHLAQYWRFANVLGTPNATSSGALICLGPRMNAGMFTAGVFAGVDYYGDVEPGGIIVWGANPAISGADGELQWWIKDLNRKNVPLIVIDPKPNELTDHAACWLKVRPGTDCALALGIINVLITEDLYDHEFVENWTVGFEELRTRAAEYTLDRVEKITWVPREEIVKAARLMASIKPLSLEWGTAVEQTENSFQTCRAIYMIPALTGNWDIPGGFVASKEIAPTADPMFGALSKEQGDKIISGPFPLNDGRMSPKMFAHPYETFDAMKTGEPYKIRALFANANNSLISMPDAKHVHECLENIEFFVCMDFFMNPTAEFADIFLPAALWPEVDSFYCMPEFADEALLTMRKAAQVGECKSDEDFFLELCQRLGLDYGASSQEEILDGLLAEMGNRYPEYAGMTFERLKKLDYIVPKRKYYRYKDEGFKTPSGKFELYCARLEGSGADPVPEYHESSETPLSDPELAKEFPLVLTTGARIQQYFVSNNRQIKSLRKAAPFPIATMNPRTGAKYGINEGDWIWIETVRGRITQKVRFAENMDERVVNAEMGWWYPEAGAPDYGWDESNVNVLTPGNGARDPFSGAYQFRGLLCRVSRNDECKIEDRYYRWINE